MSLLRTARHHQAQPSPQRPDPQTTAQHPDAHQKTTLRSAGLARGVKNTSTPPNRQNRNTSNARCNHRVAFVDPRRRHCRLQTAPAPSPALLARSKPAPPESQPEELAGRIIAGVSTSSPKMETARFRQLGAFLDEPDSGHACNSAVPEGEASPHTSIHPSHPALAPTRLSS